MELILYLLVCSICDWLRQRVPFLLWLLSGVVMMSVLFRVDYLNGWLGIGLGFALPLVAGMGAADSRVLALTGAIVGAPALALAWIVSVTTFWIWWKIRKRSLVGIPFLPWYSVVQVGIIFIMGGDRF